ncbi:family 43 glycosylhydrolase [Winogradskyella forsetii]|uniref:family 43 glycosylhydrolase n=1 Tax=Winogradskyella forsetii TaxID=2686077 RepID=UPI0015C02516|nr:family 43 glycosylhydrolase [Winogradskyella forsetii]
MRYYIILLLGLYFTSCNNSVSNIDKTQEEKNIIEISNKNPRLDKEGNIVDVHDGRVVKFKNTFYWYGTSYANTNGFTTANNYNVYSSKDLKVWKKEGRLLPSQPEGVYYRPHVIYNEDTKKYVLWYNWYPKLWDGQFGVATSDTPIGPFTIINDNVKMVRSDVGLGDFGLFVDDDKTAYISYNTIKNHQVSIEKLNNDYTGSTFENGGIIAEHMEAGSQFKRNDTYYLLTDYTCCFCNYGSGARVYTSKNPITGYQQIGNINRYPGNRDLRLNDGDLTGTLYTTLTKTDSIYNSIELQLENRIPISELKVYTFTGNRPENCGDVANPRVHPEIEIPGFNIEFWNTTAWETIETKHIKTQKTALNTVLTLSFDSLETYQLRLRPKAENTEDAIYINEIALNDNNIDFKAYVTGKNIPQRPIIPAQQTYVMPLDTENGREFIWMGDLWGSASDNIKGHDYQYWSAPLEFRADGSIKQMIWRDNWEVNL